MTTATFTASEKAFNLFRFRRAMQHVGRDEILEPAKVACLTAHAVMTGDKFLAAQILSRLGTLPQRARGLGFLLRQELEGVIAGDDPRNAHAAIEMARNCVRRARETSREIAESPASPHNDTPNRPPT